MPKKSSKEYKRYYAEFTDSAIYGATDNGWQVFDREIPDRTHGQGTALVYCRSRDIAFALRDLLNERGYLFRPKNK